MKRIFIIFLLLNTFLLFCDFDPIATIIRLDIDGSFSNLNHYALPLEGDENIPVIIDETYTYAETEYDSEGHLISVNKTDYKDSVRNSINSGRRCISIPLSLRPVAISVSKKIEFQSIS